MYCSEYNWGFTVQEKTVCPHSKTLFLKKKKMLLSIDIYFSFLAYCMYIIHGLTFISDLDHLLVV